MKVAVAIEDADATSFMSPVECGGTPEDKLECPEWSGGRK